MNIWKLPYKKEFLERRNLHGRRDAWEDWSKKRKNGRSPNFIRVLIILVREWSYWIYDACHHSVQRIKKLQGGQFDHADRLFNSIRDTWLNAAGKGNTSDVKEPSPEFFYMPEFLENRFNLDLGEK